MATKAFSFIASSIRSSPSTKNNPSLGSPFFRESNSLYVVLSLLSMTLKDIVIYPSFKSALIDLLFQFIIIRAIHFDDGIKPGIVMYLIGMGYFMDDDSIADLAFIGKQTVIEFELSLGRKTNRIIGKKQSCPDYIGRKVSRHHVSDFHYSFL